MSSEVLTNAPASTTKEFQIAKVLPVVGGHLFHDIYSAIFPTLLPVIIEKLALTLTQAGSLTAIFQLPALLHPLIGYFADKKNLRYLVILAPGVSGTLMSFIGLAPNYATIALLLLGSGISSAAFHSPAPAMIASVSGRKLGLGMGLFMSAGNIAFTIGPLLAVWAVSVWTLEGIYRLAVIGWASSLLLWIQLRNVSAISEKSRGLSNVRPILIRLFLPMTFISLFRHFLLEPLSTYLPTYISQGGASLWLAGGALTIVELAGAAGALSTGQFSDRFNRKHILVVATLIPALLLGIFPFVNGWLMIPLLLLLGLSALSAAPVLLAIVQEQLPHNRAVGNGMYMFITFLLRPLATLSIGWMGDHFGLQQAFFWGAIISLLALPAVLALPKAPQPAGTD